MRFSVTGVPPLAYGPEVGAKVYTQSGKIGFVYRYAGTITYVSPKGRSVHTSHGDRFEWVSGLSAYINDNDTVLRAFNV